MIQGWLQSWVLRTCSKAQIHTPDLSITLTPSKPPPHQHPTVIPNTTKDYHNTKHKGIMWLACVPLNNQGCNNPSPFPSNVKPLGR